MALIFFVVAIVIGLVLGPVVTGAANTAIATNFVSAGSTSADSAVKTIVPIAVTLGYYGSVTIIPLGLLAKTLRRN